MPSYSLLMFHLIYEVPLVLQRQKMDEVILRKVGLEVGPTPEMKRQQNQFSAT